MWSDSSADTTQNEYYVDTDRKAIISNQYTNRFHERKYFSNSFKSMRPDLTPEELRNFTNSFVLSERLKVAISRYYTNELDYISFLRPGMIADLAIPIYKELHNIKLFKTFYNSYNPGFSWKDYTRSVNWVERICDKVHKYGLQYPVIKLTDYEETVGEELETVRREQNRVKSTILREMGVDFSVLG